MVQVEAAPSLDSFHGRLKMSLVLGTLLASEADFSRRNQSSALWYSWWWLRFGEAGASRRKTEDWVQLPLSVERQA